MWIFAKIIYDAQMKIWLLLIVTLQNFCSYCHRCIDGINVAMNEGSPHLCRSSWLLHYVLNQQLVLFIWIISSYSIYIRIHENNFRTKVLHARCSILKYRQCWEFSKRFFSSEREGRREEGWGGELEGECMGRV